ncbi:MAG: IPT/TIG domain-containing protein [Bacteroidota bacterium]
MSKSYRSVLVLLLTGLLLQTCIRDEVLSPPEISPLTKTSWVSGELMTINGANFDPTSTKVFIDETLTGIAGTATKTVVNIIVPFTSSSKDVSLYVSTKYGTSQAIRFTIVPPLPSISKAIPNKAGIGKKIKLQGTNFESITDVVFQSGSIKTSALFQKIAADTLLVTVPKTVGFDATDISVSTANGSSRAISFTILHPPSIDSFSPGSGVKGTVVAISGQFLTPSTTVSLGTQALEIISSSPSSVVVRIAGVVKSDTLHLSTLGGDAKAAAKFELSPAPAITSVNKPSGVAGDEIIITGTALTGAFDVRFGDITTDIISNTGTTIKVKVPAGTVTSKISVTTAAGTGTSSFDFIIKAGPIIGDFTPATGVVGTKVTITGLNFGASTETPHSIKMGSLDLTSITWSDTKIEGNIPTGAVTGKMIITTTAGTFETSTNFLISGTPQITNFNPASGVAGTQVTITGINMGTTPEVKFNNVKATVITKATPTEIICTVPTGATTGKISVNSALSSTNFTVAAAPTITSVSPSRGPANADVTITGTFLTGATVQFAGVTATKTGTDTDIQIKVKVPVTAVTGKITVNNGVGTATTVSNFEVLAAPTITSFAPTSGIIGAQVTITGTNLQYNPVVKFGSVTATVSSINPTQLIVVIPAGATDGKISVTTDGTATAVSSATNFDVTTAPVITSLSPLFGPAGTTVAINGTDFGNLISVTFDATTITSFVSKSSTKIEFIVPFLSANNTTHSINVNVKTSVGTSGNSAFVYQGPPRIDYTSPESNPLTWAFLISGSNLSNVKKIVINGATATLDYKSDYTITTRVPSAAGIGSGFIKVYYTDQDFITMPYNVLGAPPPGVFPPPMIIIPPPPPGNFVPLNVDADWYDPYDASSGHWFRIDATTSSKNFDGNGDFISYKSSGSFSINEHYDGNDPELKSMLDGSYGSGSWSRTNLSFTIYRGDGPHYFTGVYNQQFQMVFTDSDTGQQMVLGTPCPNFPDCK